MPQVQEHGGRFEIDGVSSVIGHRVDGPGAAVLPPEDAEMEEDADGDPPARVRDYT